MSFENGDSPFDDRHAPVGTTEAEQSYRQAFVEAPARMRIGGLPPVSDELVFVAPDGVVRPRLGRYDWDGAEIDNVDLSVIRVHLRQALTRVETELRKRGQL